MKDYPRRTKYFSFPLVHKNYISQNKTKYDIPFYIEGIPEGFSIFSTFDEAGRIRNYIKKVNNNNNNESNIIYNNNNNEKSEEIITLDEKPKADHTYCHLCQSRYINYNEHINSIEHNDNLNKDNELFLKIKNKIHKINDFWKNNKDDNSFKFFQNESNDDVNYNKDKLKIENNSDKILGIKDIFSQSTNPTSQGSIILIEKSKKIKKRKLIEINQPINRRFNTNLLPLTYHCRKRKKSKNH